MAHPVASQDPVQNATTSQHSYTIVESPDGSLELSKQYLGVRVVGLHGNHKALILSELPGELPGENLPPVSYLGVLVVELPRVYLDLFLLELSDQILGVRVAELPGEHAAIISSELPGEPPVWCQTFYRQNDAGHTIRNN